MKETDYNHQHQVSRNAYEWQGDRFATAGEISSTLMAVPLSDNNIHSQSGPVLYARDNKVYVDHQDHHTIVEGITGSKKSRCAMAPAILVHARAGENMVISCTKGTLYHQTADYLRKKGYQIGVIDFRQKRLGDGWNPLDIPYQLYQEGDKDAAMELIDDIAHNITADGGDKSEKIDPFWNNAASDYLSAIIQALFQTGKEEEINMKSVGNMVIQGETAYQEGFLSTAFFNQFSKTSSCYACASGYLNAANNTRRSILSVLLHRLRLFTGNDSLNEMMAQTTFVVEDIAQKPRTALYILLPDEKETYHRLVSILIKQFYEYFIRIAQTEVQGQLPVRLNFILDEFSNLPAIKDFTSMISAARSRNIRFMLAYQSFSQMVARYGENAAETIVENCSNWIFFHSRKIQRLTTLRDLCGKKYRWTDGALEERHLITTNQLQQLKKGEALVFHDRTPPYIVSLPDVAEYMTGEVPKEAPMPQRLRKAPMVFSMDDSLGHGRLRKVEKL